MMLFFDLFDFEYGKGTANVAINPAFVESITADERSVYGARYEVAIIIMSSGARHIVHDPSRCVALQIMNAEGVQP